MIPSSFWCEVLQKCCRVKASQEHGNSSGIFAISRKAQLLAIRITEQPILLTNSKINRLGYKFSRYFSQKQAVKSRTRPHPCPRI